MPPGWKSLPTRFLLAYGPMQRGGNCPRMQGLPVLCKTNPPASPSPSDHSHNMAICRVGPRHGRTTTKRTRRFYPPTCRNRQVHQMDRGKTKLRSTPRRPSSSSWTSSIGLGCPTPSSPIMGPILQVTTSKSSQKGTTFESIGHRSDTHAQTGK